VPHRALLSRRAAGRREANLRIGQLQYHALNRNSAINIESQKPRGASVRGKRA